MTIHIHAAVVTTHGTASNNRGVTEGNTTTLQKLVWNGAVHTCVSAEAIRFALRRALGEVEPCNRRYNEELRRNEWQDPSFERWTEKSKDKPFIDDDLLGYMMAEGAKEENEKGTAKVRRAVLEVCRAVSMTPWAGDVTFNAASPGATPSAAKKGAKDANPVPYSTELHATRYQFGVSMTPARLRVKERACHALRALSSLSDVAGNQGRFLYDFSPDSIVFRVTHDPAPRLLYGFNTVEGGRVGFNEIVRRVRAGDIRAEELIIGGSVAESLNTDDRAVLAKASTTNGVIAACETACQRLMAALG
jgi:CRISPR-associated protein Cst2